MFKNFLKATVLTLVLTLAIPAQTFAFTETYFTVNTSTLGEDIVSVKAGETVQALQIDITTTADQRTLVPRYALIETLKINIGGGMNNNRAKITKLTLKETDGTIISTQDIAQQTDSYELTVNRAVDFFEPHHFDLYATMSASNAVSTNINFQLSDVKIRTADGLNYPPYIINNDYANFSTIATPVAAVNYKVNVYKDTADDNLTIESFNDGGDVLVHAIRLKPEQETKLKSLTLEVKGDIANYVANMKAKLSGSVVATKVATLSNGKYKFTFDDTLVKDGVRIIDLYLDPQNPPSAGKSVSGYVKVTDIEMTPVNSANSLSVATLPLESSTLTLNGSNTSTNTATNYTVNAYKTPIDDNFTIETFFDDGKDVPVHTIRFTVPEGTKLKTLTATVTGDLANYVSNLKASQDGSASQKVALIDTNGKYTFNINSNLVTNGTNFIDIYLDPSKSPASGTSVKGYVNVTGLTVEPMDSIDTVNVTGLPVSSAQLTLKSGSTLNTIKTREYEELIDNSGNPFSDISPSQLTSLEARAAIALEAKGIIGGYLVNTNGPIVEFRGYNNVNRAEAAKFLVNSLNIPESQFCTYSVASDVPVGQWYTKYVCTANKLGIMTGHDDGFFRPADWVTSEQFAKMIAKAHNLPDHPGYGYSTNLAWYTRYGLIAQYARIFPSQNGGFQPGHNLTRFEVAVAIYTVLGLNN